MTDHPTPDDLSARLAALEARAANFHTHLHALVEDMWTLKKFGIEVCKQRLHVLESRQAETEAKINRILIGDCTPDIEAASKTTTPEPDMEKMQAWALEMEGIVRYISDERAEALDKRVTLLEERLGDPKALERLQEEVQALKKELTARIAVLQREQLRRGTY